MTAPVLESKHEAITPRHEQQHTIETNVREVDPKNPKLHMIQSRADMDFTTVHKYTRMMLDGIMFEPGKAVEDAEGHLWGYDGKHRCEAAIDATNHLDNTSGKRYPLRLEVTPGTKEDAEWAALGANQFHGLPRSERDMDRIIREAFLSPKKPSMREVARHTGFSRRQVKRIQETMQKEGLLDENYTPIVKRGDQEFEQDNIEKAEKAAATRAQKTSDTPGQIEKQTEIPGTGKYYSLDELTGILRRHLSGDRKERESYLQNIAQNTVATGRAYIRGVEESLKAEPGKSWRKADIQTAAATLLRELQQRRCARCGFTGKNAQMFERNGKWYCSKCYREIEEKQLQESLEKPEIEEADASVLDEVILQTLSLYTSGEALKEVMFDDYALELLGKQIPGFPPRAIRGRCKVLLDQLSFKKAAKPASSGIVVACKICEKDLSQNTSYHMVNHEIACKECWEATQPKKPCESCGKDFVDDGLLNTATLCDSCRQQAEAKQVKPKEPELNFEFSSSDRNKIMRSGLRLIRPCWPEKRLKIYTPTDGAIVGSMGGGSWKLFEKFSTKKAMRERCKELDRDPDIIFESHEYQISPPKLMNAWDDLSDEQLEEAIKKAKAVLALRHGPQQGDETWSCWTMQIPEKLLTQETEQPMAGASKVEEALAELDAADAEEAEQTPLTVKELCSSCEHHRSRNNPKHGKSLKESYYGKCIREGGLCDEVKALMADEKPTVEYTPLLERYRRSLDEIRRLMDEDKLPKEILEALNSKGLVDHNGRSWSIANVRKTVRDILEAEHAGK